MIKTWINWFAVLLAARKRRRQFFLELRCRNEYQEGNPSFQKAIDLIGDSFQIYGSDLKRLYPTDTLSWIYEGVAGAYSDCLENEILHLNVEQELKRPLHTQEAKQIRTVGDLANLLSFTSSSLKRDR